MKIESKIYRRLFIWVISALLPGFGFVGPGYGGGLADVKERGLLRHLGVPYANFVTGAGDGMSVELMKGFAKNLGVKYEYVKTDWGNVIGDLTGKKVKAVGKDIEILGDVPVKGDVIANGLTIIPWRMKIVDFSTPTFPTQVWIMARSDSSMHPIRPGGNISEDIATVKGLIKGKTIMGVKNTCLDPALYGVAEAGGKVKLFKGNLNELAPAVINGEAEGTLLDVPDALIALDKWPGAVKVIGPLSKEQNMGCGFAKSSPQLRDAFNRYLAQCKKDGTYLKLVKKYYPAVFDYYRAFFKDAR